MIKYSHWGEGLNINKITFPVPLSAYSAKEAPYVYTKKAEEFSLALGLENRKAGTIAMLGNKPLDGPIGRNWMERGLVVPRSDADVD